jgi:hypothetical protein
MALVLQSVFDARNIWAAAGISRELRVAACLLNLITNFLLGTNAQCFWFASAHLKLVRCKFSYTYHEKLNAANCASCTAVNKSKLRFLHMVRVCLCVSAPLQPAFSWEGSREDVVQTGGITR